MWTTVLVFHVWNKWIVCLLQDNGLRTTYNFYFNSFSNLSLKLLDSVWWYLVGSQIEVCVTGSLQKMLFSHWVGSNSLQPHGLTVACQAPLSFTIPWSLLKLMSIKLVMPSNHLILCHPLLLLPSIFHSIRVFSNESALHIRWPKYWSFSFSISPSNEYSGLISFKIDLFDLLAVQGTPNSLLQHQIQKHRFFSAQPSLWSSSHNGIF